MSRTKIPISPTDPRHHLAQIQPVVQQQQQVQPKDDKKK